jgi:hypothetical protein
VTLPWRPPDPGAQDAVRDAQRCAEEARTRLRDATADDTEVHRIAGELRELRLRNHFKIMLGNALREAR